MMFIDAIKKNDATAFNELLQVLSAGNRAMIDEVDELGNGAVHWAAILGYAHFIEPLLDAAPNVNVDLPNLQGDRPIHLAAQNGHLAVIRMLKETNATIDLTTSAGLTAAHIAALQNRVYTMNELIAVGANIDFSMPNGTTPLYIAAMKGHVHIMTVLLDASANANILMDADEKDGPRPLAQVANNVDAKRLLEEHFKFYPTGIKPYIVKPYQSHRAAVKQLKAHILPELNIMQIVDANAYSVFDAAFNGNSNLITEFIKEGRDINRRLRPSGITPLYIATVSGHLKVVKVLLDAGANAKIDTYNGSVLDAVKRGTQQIHAGIATRLEGHLARYPAGIRINELGRAQTTKPYSKPAPVCSQSPVAKHKHAKKRL